MGARREIFAVIFEMRFQNCAAVDFCRTASGNCRAGRIARPYHLPDATASVLRHYALYPRMRFKEMRALSQGHGMRLHRAHLLHSGPRWANQIVRNRQNHFRLNRQLALQQQPVGVDGTVQTIFDR